jgi:CheY-like chemotaxis protein
MKKKPKKILVVDDSPIVQNMTEKLLKSNGYDVITAWAAEECIEKAMSELPDAILLDIILPDGDGKDIAKKLKGESRTKNIPIIFISNTIDMKDDKGYESFEIEGEICRAFAKPLRRRKILSVIRREINRSVHGGKLPKGLRKSK